MKRICLNCDRWKQDDGSIFGNFTGTCERAATVEVMFNGDCIHSGQPYELKGDNVWTAERIPKPMVHINAVKTYGKFGCIHWQKKKPIKDPNKMTFLRYCFNRNGFGRTHWIAALWVHAFGAVSVGMALHGEPLALLGLVAPVALLVGTWMNYTRRWK